MRTCLCRSATRPRETNAGAWLGHGTHPGGLGVHDARDTLCPKPAQRALRSGAQLCVSSTSPPAIRARRGGAVRSCWASSRSRRAIVPHAMALRQRRARACTGCACGRAAPPPMAQQARACWGRHATSTTLHRPWSLYATGTGPLRRPQALGRHESATARRSRAEACCW